VIGSTPAEAGDLAEFIKENLDEEYKIIKIDSIWGLERGLDQYEPVLVITDTHIDDKFDIDNILNLVSAKNPDARFIVTSKGAAIFHDDLFKGFDVLGVVEKPSRGTLRIIQDKKPLRLLLEGARKKDIDSGA